jgi:C4-dicarboxylate-specific signal transduction histidine kinase
MVDHPPAAFGDANRSVRPALSGRLRSLREEALAAIRGIALLAALFWQSLPALGAQNLPEPTRILIVYGHDPNAPGVFAFAQELRAVVREQGPPLVEFYEELLDLDRFPEPERLPQLARYLSEKYREFSFDAVVAEGSLALRFTMEHLSDLFPGVPVVYGLAFEPVVDFSALPAHVTGSRLPLPFTQTLAMARALQPDAERVVLVGGAAPLDSVMLSAALREITPQLEGLELVVLQDWSYQSLLDSLRALPPRTFVMLSAFRRDQRGYEFNTGDIIPSVTRVASVPVYGIARNWVGDGVVGGSVMDFGGDGIRAGRLLVRVLRRQPYEPIPGPEVAVTPLVADARQLQRWGLSESLLPPGTEVLFRPPTLWERYRGAILGLLAALTAQSLLIVLLLLERRRRLGAQRAVEEQAAYDRMIAALTNDTARVGTDHASLVLENALARIAHFAGADSAVLVVDAGAQQAGTRIDWSTAADGEGTHPLPAASDPLRTGDARVEIPLATSDGPLGVLELRRNRDATWPAAMVLRLEAAADVVAGALARARASRVLEQTRDQVAHIARVATLGEMAAAVSHELRQPLTAMLANAEAGGRLLEVDPPDVGEAREVFREVMREAMRASEVIEHIRVLIRNEEPTRTTVDLNEVCRKTARLLDRDAAMRGVHLELALDAPPSTVTGDAVQLQQALINLTLNALDAAAGSAGAHVVLGTAAEHGELEIFVRDTGPGIPPDVAARLFRPFFSTKPRGLGMGLAIVRTVVERHRGRIQAENGAAGGAVFRIVLPTSEPSPRRWATGRRSVSLAPP